MNTISSKDNKVVKHISKLLSSSSYREENGEFVIEGKRLCEDALKSDIKIKSLFYTQKAREKYTDTIEKLSNSAENFYEFNDKIFHLLTDTKNPQGIVCLCKILDKIDSAYIINSKKHTVGLENINDPSNLGTILRTAEALGVKNVVLSKACCDIYNPKVIRGSMGAVFRLKFFIAEDMPEFVDIINSNGFVSCGSVASGNFLPITKVDFKLEPFFMLIGNEANGLSQEVIRKCKLCVNIPIKGYAESLNAAAAAAILIWEMMK